MSLVHTNATRQLSKYLIPGASPTSPNTLLSRLNQQKTPHRWALRPWQAWYPHVPLHATWSWLAGLAFFPRLSSAALRSFIPRLSWRACLQAGGC